MTASAVWTFHALSVHIVRKIEQLSASLARHEIIRNAHSARCSFDRHFLFSFPFYLKHLVLSFFSLPRILQGSGGARPGRRVGRGGGRGAGFFVCALYLSIQRI